MSNDFKTFSNWLFDGNYTSDPPESLTSSSSKISNIYCISLFMKCGKLNHYINKYLNNIGIFYVPKYDLFKFIKQSIKDYKISKRDVWYFSKRKKQDNLFDVLHEKYPLLKDFEIYHLCDLINNSKDKNKILQGLGLKTDVKKQKVNKKDKKINNKKEQYDDLKITEFLNKNFSIVDLN